VAANKRGRWYVDTSTLLAPCVERDRSRRSSVASVIFVTHIHGLLFSRYPVTVTLTDNYEVKLEPFQIVFLTSEDADDVNDENDMASNDSFDKMTLLSVTREHLNNEFSQHDNFLSLSLFQMIRSDGEMFSNGTHAAFTGTVSYVGEPDIAMTQENMLEIEYMCFLEANAEVYVEALRAMGWRSLKRAMLLTVGGDMVEYKGGTMVMVDMSEDSEDSASTEMDEDTSKMIYFVAVFVPVGAAVLAVLCCAVCLARKNVTWKQSSDPNGLVWQADPNKARQLRRMTLEIKNGDDTSSAASEITDVPSVKAAVASTRKSSPRRPSVTKPPVSPTRKQGGYNPKEDIRALDI